MAYLKVVGGPHAGEFREIKEPKLVLGRAVDCDIYVEHLETSRHHARLVLENGGCFLDDLHSVNGTFVNDERERVRGRRTINEGDRVRVSDAVFEFHQGPCPAEASESSSSSGSFVAPILLDDAGESANLVVVSKRDVAVGQDTSRSHDSLEAVLGAILEITQSLRQTLAIDKVMPQILDTLFLIFPCAERGFIVLLDDNGRITRQWLKHQRAAMEPEIHISRTIVKRVMQSQQAILSADAADDSRFRNSDSLSTSPIGAMMCAPLIDSAGRSFGVLQIDTASDRGRFQDSNLDVLLGVATQASIAIENARFHERALEQQAFERDKELAHHIQQSFLPTQPPQVPGYEFFDYYQPASHVGGDFFSYIPLADGRLIVVLADVTGHGLAAAMLTAKLAADVRYRVLALPRPAEVMTQMNASLAQDLVEDHFVTLVLIELNPGTGEVTVVNAGHMAPIVRSSQGLVSEIGKDESGWPLGVREETVYRSSSFRLSPGGLLMVYSDGINEALNAVGQRYGIGRLLRQMASPGRARQVGGKIIDDLRQFVEGCPQTDDMCLVCFSRE